MLYEAKENEFLFELTPIGVGYRCEFCHEGEMISHISRKDPQGMYTHFCDNCKKKMLLPKVYPYIEWNRKESSEE